MSELEFSCTNYEFNVITSKETVDRCVGKAKHVFEMQIPKVYCHKYR